MRHEHSKVSDPNSFRSHVGNKFRVTYDSFRNSDGTIRLKESGRTDIKKEINSHAAETDMAIIISRLQFGDTSVLSSKRPMYGDFTKFPTTYAEAFDLVARSNKAFEALPDDVRAVFDNDVAKWFASIGSDKWLSAMGIEKPSSPVPDVTPDPSHKKVLE